MPQSDRFDFRVGDRVQDRQTGREGRVTNVVSLSRDVLVITVAIFVAGRSGIAQTLQEQVKRGQIAGLRFEKVGRAARDVARGGALTQPGAPGRGGQVSQAAVDRAKQNLSAESMQLTQAELREIRDQLLRDEYKGLKASPVTNFFQYWDHVLQRAKELERADPRLQGKLEKSLQLLLRGTDSTKPGGSVLQSLHQYERGASPNANASAVDDILSRVSRARNSPQDRIIAIAEGKTEAKLLKYEAGFGTVKKTLPKGMPDPQQQWVRIDDRTRVRGHVHAMNEFDTFERVFQMRVEALDMWRQQRNILDSPRKYGEKDLIRARRKLSILEKGLSGVDKYLEAFYGREGLESYWSATTDVLSMSNPEKWAFELQHSNPLAEGLAGGPPVFGSAELGQLQAEYFRTRGMRGGVRGRVLSAGVPEFRRDPLFLTQMERLHGPVAPGMQAPMLARNRLDDLVGQVIRHQGLPHRIVAVDGQTKRFTLAPLQSEFQLFSPLPFHDSGAVMQLLDALKTNSRFRKDSAVERLTHLSVTLPGRRGAGPNQLVGVTDLFAHLFGTAELPGSAGLAFGAFSEKQLSRLLPWNELSLFRDVEPATVRSYAHEILTEQLTHPELARRLQGRTLPAVERILRQSVVEGVVEKHLRETSLLAGKGTTREQLEAMDGRVVLESQLEQLDPDKFRGISDMVSTDLAEMQGRVVMTPQELRAIPDEFRRLRRQFSTDTETLAAITGAEPRSFEAAADASSTLRRILQLQGQKGSYAERQRLLKSLRSDLGIELLDTRSNPALKSQFEELTKLRAASYPKLAIIQKLQEIQAANQAKNQAAVQARLQELFRLGGLKGQELLDPAHRAGKLRELSKLLAQADDIRSQLGAAESAWGHAKLLELSELERAMFAVRAHQSPVAAGSARMQQLVGTLLPENLSLQNLSQVREKLEALLDVIEQGGAEAVPLQFRDMVTAQGGQVGIRLYSMPGRKGEQFVFRRGGIIQSLHNPDRFMLLQGGDPFEVTFEELARHVGPKDLFSKRLGYSMKRMATEDAIHQAIDSRPPSFGLFQGEGNVLAFTGKGSLAWSSVRDRTLSLLDPKTKGFIGLDIETALENGVAGEVRNIAAVQYARHGDKFRSVGVFNAALAGSEFERSVRESGGQVFGTERELLEGAAKFLGQRQGTVAAHNVAFDAPHLIERARATGASEETLKAFRGVAGRAADTLLLGQAALPGMNQRALQKIRETLLGGADFGKAHDALPDVSVMAEYLNTLQEPRYLERATRALRGAREIKLKTGSLTSDQVQGTVFWDRKVGRAYELIGEIDPERAGEALQRLMNGNKLEQAYGLAMREVNFTDPRTASLLAKDVNVLWAGTPAALAKKLGSNLDVVKDHGRLQELMTAKAEDLARRRVRRTLSGQNAFEQLMLERERFRRLTGQEGETSIAGIAERTAAWMERFGQDTRMQQQLQLSREFWEKEMPQHRAVVDWLEDHVARSGEGPAQRAAFTEANTVWEHYFKRTSEALGDFERIRNVEIPLHERKVSFHVPILGEHARAVRVGSEELIREDLTDLAHRIVNKMGPDQAARMLGGGEEVSARISNLLANGKLLWETETGDRLLQQVWQEHLRNAFRSGTVQVDQAQQSLRLEARTMADAVSELLTKGNNVAQQIAESIPNQLAPRAFNPAAQASLERIQRQTLRGVDAALAEAAGGLGPVFSSSHGVPENWLGESLRSLATEAAGSSVETQQHFLRRLRGATSRMSAVEAHQTRTILAEVFPEGITDVFKRTQAFVNHQRIAEAAEAAAEVTARATERTFQASAGQQVAMNMAEAVVDNAGKFKMAGLVAGGALGTTLLIAGLTSSKHRGKAPEPTGFRSSPEEVEERRHNVQRQVPQTHELNIRISGEDPIGIDHNELLKSVNEVLGQHFTHPLPMGEPQVMDNRQKVDRGYLDNLASRLLTPNAHS